MCLRLNGNSGGTNPFQEIKKQAGELADKAVDFIQDMGERAFGTTTQAPAAKSNVNVSNSKKSNMSPVAKSFPTPPQQRGATPTVTRDTLLGALRRSDIASLYNNPANRPAMERIADLAISVGQRENVDPRLLFAMAMQESNGGLSLDHPGSATGAMGIMPDALTAVQRDPVLSQGLKETRHSSLRNDPEKSMVVAARYLKIAAREFEAQTTGNSGVTASDLAPNNLSKDTWAILASYRHGARNAAKDYNADKKIDRGYEPAFQNYLRLLNVNIVSK